MQSSIPSFDVGLESEEGGLHSCCVRRRNSEVLRSLLRAPEPLDRDDQKKIIKAIADEQEQQQAFAGQLLRGVIALVLLLHGYLLLQQTLRPWSTKLLAHFYNVGQSFATVSFVASTAAYSIYLARVWQLCAGKKLYRQSRLLLASKGAAAASLLFWSVALWTAAKGRDEGYWPALKFWWLPLGPFLLLIIVEHVLAMLASSSKDLASLKSRMYDFKSA